MTVTAVTAQNDKVYYLICYRIKKPNWNPLFRQTLGCYEDLRDAVQAIVTAYRKNPSCQGEFGIVTTRIKTSYKFYPSRYKQCEER